MFTQMQCKYPQAILKWALVSIFFPCFLFPLHFTLGDNIRSRVISTKYGKIQGVIRHHQRPFLPPVEIYLGIPYASPPIGHGRFTPTSSPLPWDHVMQCDTLPPACPQPYPSKAKEHSEEEEEDEGYYRSFENIIRNQNEDCLYLNIYAPHRGERKTKYPVIVFIHGGKSFQRGSGNFYDGGILSSYGQTVVITFNYRLGPLGFLNASPGGTRSNVVSNQGLMDQLAALSWIQENIIYFDGDPTRVTLMGHSTGAACVGHLIASPVVVPGLFHRAILMSGSALSPWADVPDALSVSVRLAKMLKCPVPSDLSRSHPQTVACLRNASVEELVNAKMPNYKFASVYGPSVDGVVITRYFLERLTKSMKEKEISVLFGVTEGDAFTSLSERQIDRGLTLPERNRIFRTFVRNTYQHHLQEIYLAIAKEYTDWANPSQHPLQVRDLTIDAISDGAFLAPLIRFADIISSRTEAYMYVFTHRARDDIKGSIFRSELSLIFGEPFRDIESGSFSSETYKASSSSPKPSLFPNSPFKTYPKQMNFSRNDAIVSEYLMRYWTNFAKSGNPNLPEPINLNLNFGELSTKKNTTWEAYDQVFEKYIDINSRPRQKDHYRAHKVALWNWLLPELEDAGSKYPDTESELWHTIDVGKYFIGPVRPIDPFRFLKPTEYSTSVAPAPSPNNGYLTPNVSAAHGFPNRKNSLQMEDNEEPKGKLIDYTTALTLTVAIGLSLLVLNVILFAALLYKKESRNIMGSKIKFDSVSAQALCTVDSSLRSVAPSRDNSTPPIREIHSTCAPQEPQCEELTTFPSPPDIGDRNTHFGFTSSSSMHSFMSQSTCKFIPPPPLLSTTTSCTSTGAEIECTEELACPSAQCCMEGNIDYTAENKKQFSNSEPNSQYCVDPNYSVNVSPSSEVTKEKYSQHCNASLASCSESTSYAQAPPTNQQCSSEMYHAVQYPPSHEKFSIVSDNFSSLPIHYVGSSTSIHYQEDPNRTAKNIFPETVRDNDAKNRRRQCSLTRQLSSSSKEEKKSILSILNSPAPAFATLPRKNSKENIIP